MELMAKIMQVNIAVMIIDTGYIFWKNRDIFSYNPK